MLKSTCPTTTTPATATSSRSGRYCGAAQIVRTRAVSSSRPNASCTSAMIASRSARAAGRTRTSRAKSPVGAEAFGSDIWENNSQGHRLPSRHLASRGCTPSEAMVEEDNNKAWRQRPLVSAELRFAIFVAPIGASLGVAIWVLHFLPQPRTHALLLVRWALSIASSTAALLAVDRLTRRLMPLAVMLKLSLAFPKEVPSRIKLARRVASTKKLEQLAERARREGISDEPSRAAVQILELIAAVEAHDRNTRGHSERVRLFVDLLGAELKLSTHDRDRLRWAALLHDVGKLMVPPEILRKPSKLTPPEWEHIHRHPEEGARLTTPLRAWLGDWAKAIEEHHERYDGEGYPRR